LDAIRGAAEAPLDERIACEVLPYHAMASGKYAGLGREATLSDVAPPAPEDADAWIARLREGGVNARRS
jgi:pyruvate-formate lyase-activating enzyme